MIDISTLTHPDLYVDYEKTLEFLRSIHEDKYKYPKDVVNFHVYSEVNDNKELLAIESYFATQNTDNTKLVLWSDWDIRNNELLKPYASRIDFRVFDPIELSKGTILEGHTNVLLASDEKHYMKSGLLRFLALYKYGGIWFDMDMILLRNLLPILDQEFAYVWGSESHDFTKFGPCAAFMGINKESEHAKICLEELLIAPVIPNTVSRDCDMLAKVYACRPFTVFPSVFFNTEWQINNLYFGLGDKIQDGWFSANEYSDRLFLEAFAWHWHNSHFKNHIVEKDSKFDRLTQYIHTLLKRHV